MREKEGILVLCRGDWNEGERRNINWYYLWVIGMKDKEGILMGDWNEGEGRNITYG